MVTMLLVPILMIQNLLQKIYSIQTQTTLNRLLYPKTNHQLLVSCIRSSFSTATNPSWKVPYGESTDAPDSEYYLHIDPSVKKNGAPNFKLSNCQGKKKALLIGINYFGTEHELNGCINDVENIESFLISNYEFKREDMVILTDDHPHDSKYYPTRANILASMHWLVEDAQPNDS